MISSTDKLLSLDYEFTEELTGENTVNFKFLRFGGHDLITGLVTHSNRDVALESGMLLDSHFRSNQEMSTTESTEIQKFRI